MWLFSCRFPAASVSFGLPMGMTQPLRTVKLCRKEVKYKSHTGKKNY